MRFLDRARSGLKSVSARRGSGSMYQPGGTARDFSRQVGRGYDVAPIYSAVMFAQTQFSSVEIVHERPKAGSSTDFERVNNSQIERLFASPNGWYTWDDYLSGLFVSEMAGMKGTSYSYKHRSTGGRVVALEYLPHHGVNPYTAGNGKFVDHYRLNLGNGGMRTEDPRNILVQRFGFMDPSAVQQSFGPLAALYLEVANIRQANAYTANMLGNVAAGKLLSLGKTPDGTAIVFGEEQEKQIKQTFAELRQDGVGGVGFVPLGIDIHDLQWSPSDLKFDAIQNIAEEHVCACFLIAPASLYLGTGLENQNNRASAEAAAKATARSFSRPYMERKSAHLTFDLIPELGEPGDRIRFVSEGLEALQQDRKAEAEADEIEMEYLTINEKREQKGQPRLNHPDADLPLSILKARKGAKTESEMEGEESSRTNGKPHRQPATR